VCEADLLALEVVGSDPDCHRLFWRSLCSLFCHSGTSLGEKTGTQARVVVKVVTPVLIRSRVFGGGTLPHRNVQRSDLALFTMVYHAPPKSCVLQQPMHDLTLTRAYSSRCTDIFAYWHRKPAHP